MSDKLQKYEAGVAVASPMDIESLCRAAVDKGKEGVEVLERLMVIRRELNAENAKAAFDAALAAFQDECPPIPKGKQVRDNSGARLYNYAPFEEILRLVRPVMRKHGLSFTLDTDTGSQDGWVIAKAKVTHTAGHSEISTAKFPLGGGTRAMSTTQIYAAALSFASRRVFCNALGLVTVGEDYDGAGDVPRQHAPSSKPPTEAEEQAAATKALWAALKPILAPGAGWNEARAWLIDHAIIPVGCKAVTKLSAAELKTVLEKAEIQMKQDAGEV